MNNWTSNRVPTTWVSFQQELRRDSPDRPVNGGAAGTLGAMPGQPELRHLRTFVVAAEELHFTRAAERMHLTQQSLSNQIRQLEASVGVPLFDRTTRKVELTAAGRRMLAHAIPLLNTADRAWEDVAEVGSGGSGQVTLSYSPTVRREMLPLLLAELRRRHPRLDVRSAEVWWGHSALADRLIEVSLTRSHPPDDDPQLLSVPVMHSTLGLVLGREHPLAKGETVAVSGLRDEALKLWPRPFSPSFYDTILSALRDSGFTGPVEELVIFGSGILRDDPAACAEIASGRAFGIGFKGQYEALEPDLVWRPVEPTIRIPIYLAWHRESSPAVRNVVAVALDVARAQDWLPAERHDEARLLLAA
jgi:DNA-binding transcriptional LysR family regulator